MFDKINISPMLLKEVDKVFQDNDYLYEIKYDGIRVLIYASSNSIHIITRNKTDVTNVYPELKSIEKLVKNKKVIFDGEIVAFKNNKPSFSELQKRSHLKNKNKIAEMMHTIPVAFIAFDIIYENRELIDLPLIKRKEILAKYPDTEVFIKTKTYNDGVRLFKQVKRLGLEGIVAKRKDSVYVPNTRLDYWVKIKNFHQEYFYIYGYQKQSIKYTLFLGEYENKQFKEVGHVSVTKDNEILECVLKQKKTTKNGSIFVSPKYQILVTYMERTNNNHLRQPFIR